MGCMVQSNSIAETMNTAFGIPTWVMGLIVVILAGIVFIGGVSRLAAVTEKIVPIMAVLYVLGSLVILIMNAANIPATFALIFQCAFNPDATVGGATFGIIAAIARGAKRGLFSNEAGMGSTPHAHALAEVKDPHEQGVVAMIGVFVDTIVVVTMTASWCCRCSTWRRRAGHRRLRHAHRRDHHQDQHRPAGLGQFFGENLGAWFVAICLLFFAFSTILSWNLFAKLNVEWLFGKKGVMPSSPSSRWPSSSWARCSPTTWYGELADMFNQLMVIPNAIALFALSGAVLAIASAKHDKRALDAAEERLEDQEARRHQRHGGGRQAEVAPSALRA